ncbi:EamA family transporter [Puia sp. P3]|uniref:EamA family transporter n=1 Tax=Puia sp. P3 TaxID=3423952 RepID=UPI003D67BF01
MSTPSNRPASTIMVVVAFAIVYVVWGSTYFFIRLSVLHIPPMMVGAFRFILAGTLMLLWCLFTRKKLFSWKVMRPAIVSGLLLLGTGNGALIWSEQYIPSSLAAILLAAGPVWFVLLDKGKWKENFRSRSTIVGLVVGFVGVLLLFVQQLSRGLSGEHMETVALVVLVLGSVSWAAGSLYSKYRTAEGSSNAVNAGWQMFAAGVAFIPASLASGEWGAFHPAEVPLSSWMGIVYLVTMGSLVGYSAFVWLLQVRPATQVSTHAYVNPVVAVLLGTLFAGERMSWLQLTGLAVILVSVLLINLSKYRSVPGTRPQKRAGVMAAE